jgi:hypothetical protein
MPGATPNLGLPYPLGNERVDVAGDIRRLADALDAVAANSRAIPAGTVTMTIAATPDPGYLFLQGQSVPNADATYPSLWAKAPAGWKVGTSFVFPDMRQAFPGGFAPGSAAHGVLGMAASSNTKSIAAGNLPPHQHSIDHDHGQFESGNDTTHHHHSLSGHAHRGGTSQDGYHDHGWTPGLGFMYNDVAPNASSVIPNTGGLRLAPWSAAPNHAHTFVSGGPVDANGNTLDTSGGVIENHKHTVDVPNFTGGLSGNGPGGGTGLDITPRTVAVNFQVKAH